MKLSILDLGDSQTFSHLVYQTKMSNIIPSYYVPRISKFLLKLRVLYVALTRAKGKFIGVANISYMEKKNLSKSYVVVLTYTKDKWL